MRLAIPDDFCLDACLMLDSSRAEVSIETGPGTRAVRERRSTPGGAGSVAATCTAFGSHDVLDPVTGSALSARLEELLARGAQPGRLSLHPYSMVNV